MIEKLELNHLRMLSALYRMGSMSAAAEHLDVSQQGVSLQLKRVRDVLEDPLFVRIGHGMVPTRTATRGSGTPHWRARPRARSST